MLTSIILYYKQDPKHCLRIASYSDVIGISSQLDHGNYYYIFYFLFIFSLRALLDGDIQLLRMMPIVLISSKG